MEAIMTSWKLYALIAVPLTLIGFSYRAWIGARVVDLISTALNLYLQTRYPIRHGEDGSPLPGAPYRFPNGQGDAEKFIHGKENSVLWERQYGSIYRIWSGMNTEVVVTRPEHIREVFKDSDKHIKATNNNSGYFLGELLGRCVGLVSQNEWKTLRAVSEKAFVRSKATSYVPLVVDRTDRYFRELWNTSDLPRSIIDPAKDLQMLAFWVIAEIVYGGLSSSMETELRVIAPRREKLFRFVLKGGLTRFAWSKYLPTTANAELCDFRIRWSAFNRQARDWAVAQGRLDAPIVEMYRAVDEGIITLDEALQTLDEVLFANLDVTLGGIAWNLVFLAAYPDVQDSLRREIAEARRQEPLLERYFLSSSTLLAACISESSRLRPLAAFSVPQAAPTPRVVGGYYFPAGTSFIVDSYALNQRDPYWGKDGERYRPARWFERNALQARYHFWRFGFGPRQCMGKYVADLIIRVLLVHLVENYELGLIRTGEEFLRDVETWIDHPQMQLRCTLREEREGQ